MTALEWLVQQIFGEHTEAWQEEIQQALEMEKEQILKAYDKGYDDVDVYEPEKYYSETYKKDKCICKNAELEKDSLVQDRFNLALEMEKEQIEILKNSILELFEMVHNGCNIRDQIRANEIYYETYKKDNP